MRILLVKTSSLGDVVHNLPVIADIRRNIAEAVVDWVVEESFAAVPRLHAGVRSVIPVAMRRWRKSMLSRSTWAEIEQFVRQLRSVSYDAVIDTQGLLKSALIARAVRGVRHGLDWASSREPLRFFYDHTHSVPWGQHAVQRNRLLAAQALDYTRGGVVNYGISAPINNYDWLPSGSFVVLLHASSAERKFWPETHWIEFARKLVANGMRSVLPWGSETERMRAARLAQNIPDAVVSPRLGLADAAALLGKAKGVVGIDTGLTHLAAALSVPTVGVYCDTDPAATGVYGCPKAVNLGGVGASPRPDDVWFALNKLWA